MNEETFKPDKLNGDNFHHWKFNMRMFLIGKDLWDIVNGDETLNPHATQKERDIFRKRDNKALSIISLSVATDIQIYVRSANNSKEAWKSLCDRFEEKTLAKICYYRKILYRMELGKGQSMEAYVNHMKTVAEHLENLDDPVSEKDLVYILISSLPSEYDNLITALETLKKEQLTWSYVRDRVISEYIRKKGCEVVKKSSHDALYTSDSGGKRNNYHNSNYNNNSNQHNNHHNSNNQNSNGKLNQFTKKDQGNGKSNVSNFNKKMNMTCHHCKEKGHLRRDCPKYLASSKSSGVASFSSVQNDVNPIPTFSHEFALKISSSDGDSVGDNWYVDSAATSHMNYDLDEFQNYKKFDEPLKVKLADDSFLLAPGSGDVSVRLYDSACPRPRQFDVLLQNTLYVPDIGNKLFSIASVTENGGSVKLEKTNCTLEQGGKEVGIGTKEGRLYKLNTVLPEHACNLAAGSPLSLWHLRYGHLNYNDLKLLFDQKLVNGLTLTSVDRVEDCHGCAVGKAKRLPFPKKSTRKTTRPLELIHSDVCGPFHVDSVGGSRYFVTFVDDYSRYVTVYMLTAKSEAFDKFVDFVIMSENKFGVEIQNFELEGELGVKLKKFRSDGGGEYVSSRFIEFCSSGGIEKQITVPYTPQQNGVAERMNRTLMEMARSMIYHANCSQKLWAEAVATAAYLRNRCPTSTFQGATPYERWFGEKPDVDHLRIFGCDVYVHVPDQKRRKLEPKAIKGVFVGYPDGTKGYKIFMPNSGKMICSRDVQFLESSFGTRDKRAVVDVFDIAYDKTPCTATDLSQPGPPAHFSTHQFDTNFDTFDTNFDNFDTDFGMNFDNFDTIPILKVTTTSSIQSIMFRPNQI